MFHSLDVLLVGKILESSGVPLDLAHCHALPGFGFLLVFPDEGISKHDKQCQLDTVGDQQGTNAQVVFWRLICLVEEWLSGDISGTIMPSRDDSLRRCCPRMLPSRSALRRASS